MITLFLSPGIERGKQMNKFKHATPFYQQKQAAEAPIDRTKIIEQTQLNQFTRKWQPAYQKKDVQTSNSYAKQIAKLSQNQTTCFEFEDVGEDENIEG